MKIISRWIDLEDMSWFLSVVWSIVHIHIMTDAAWTQSSCVSDSLLWAVFVDLCAESACWSLDMMSHSEVFMLPRGDDTGHDWHGDACCLEGHACNFCLLTSSVFLAASTDEAYRSRWARRNNPETAEVDDIIILQPTTVSLTERCRSRGEHLAH